MVGDAGGQTHLTPVSPVTLEAVVGDTGGQTHLTPGSPVTLEAVGGGDRAISRTYQTSGSSAGAAVMGDAGGQT